MTRKQALQRAIHFLSKHPEYKEDIRILQEISDELPLIHWSNTSIRDTVEQFILDNGRVPTTSDFKRKGMPPHTVIRQKYKITLREWLEQNYPVIKLTPLELKEKYTKDFIEDYHRIKPKSQKEFNQNKRQQTKGWQTVAQLYEVKSWRKLLNALDLPLYYGKEKEHCSTDISVNFYVDYDFSE